MTKFQELFFCGAAMLCIFVLLGERCGAASFGAATDAMGNIYPAECPESIVDDPALQSRIVTIHALLPATLGGTTLGWLVDGKAIVTINTRLGGWRERDTRRHEDCHALLLLEGKPINWHPHQSDYIPNQRPPERCADVFHC